MRYLLVSLDTKPDGYIEADEVPDGMQRVFDELLERFDANDNDALERYELSRGFQGLGQIAARYAARERSNPAAELKKLEKTQGKAINRFEEQQRPIIEQFGDPEQARRSLRGSTLTETSSSTRPKSLNLYSRSSSVSSAGPTATFSHSSLSRRWSTISIARCWASPRRT